MSLLLKSATERLRSAVRDVPDFPQPGIIFKDITPILQNAQLFRLAITLFADRYQRRNVDVVAAIDARGFLFASALAYCLGTGLALVRKKGKLPFKTIEASYELEYGKNTLSMHVDAITPGQKVVLIDDVLATGGTAQAALQLIHQLGGDVVETAFLVELGFLNGRPKLGSTPIFSIITY
jgi:adenine phosphoribosyltransferase